MGVAGVVAIISAFAAIVGAATSVVSTEWTNKSNQKINEQNLDFQKAQTQEAWERDDTYYQRSTADAEAAGLSPLAINGAMPSSSPLGAPSPIAMQAPQFDTNALMQAILSSAELGETNRHNVTGENQRAQEIQNDTKELELKGKQLDIQNKDVESQIKYRISMQKLESRRIAETIRANKKDEEIKENEYNLKKASFESERYYKEIKAQAGGDDVPYKVINDWNDYLSARDIYLQAYNDFLDEIGSTRTATSSSSAGGANVGVAGVGVGINGSGSDYNSDDISMKQKVMWDKFQKSHPVPVFIYSDNK